VVVEVTFEVLRDWFAFLGLGGMVGTLAALIVKAIIERKSRDHEHRWQDARELRDRAQDTDRATYNQRLTILVREHLVEFVRSGEWPTHEEDLLRLLASLRQRTYEHFLDPKVNQKWETLVARSVELAWRRFSNRISESEIRQYNQLRTDWEDACKRSFGPLPPAPGPFMPRHDPHDQASGDR